MILVAALLLAASEPVPLQTDALRCAGGVMIFFERGSARIDPENSRRLDGIVIWSHNHAIPESWRIESGGDGQRSQFDAALSRRRSEAIRDYLRARDYRPQEVVIAVQEELGQLDGDDPLARELALVGWVTRRISREDNWIRPVRLR